MKVFSPIATTLAALGFAQTSYSLATFHPDGGPTYSVGLPQGSSISGSSTGPIYFSLSAPTSFRWVGLGIGGQMAKATIFVMYADGTGNVTISARDGGRGHVEPQFDSTLAAGVELLAGSGVSGGVMKANVRCTTCTLSSSDLSSSPFISAWQTGSSLDSTSTSAHITQHDDNSYRQFSFDLNSASISSDTNPFVSSSPAASSASSGASKTGTATSAGSSASSTSSSGSGSSGDDDGDSDDDGGNSGSVETGGGSEEAHKVNTYNKAHGIIMGLAVVVIFPLGAILQRVVGGVVLHGIFQIVALAMLIAGFGLGVELAKLTNYLYKDDGNAHTVFGTIIFALFLIQPFLGLLHHTLFKKYNSRTSVSHIHIWFGRIIIICAVINGGLGLKLAANTDGGKIAYGVVSGVVAVIYVASIFFKRKGGDTKWAPRREKHELRSRDGSS